MDHEVLNSKCWGIIRPTQESPNLVGPMCEEGGGGEGEGGSGRGEQETGPEKGTLEAKKEKEHRQKGKQLAINAKIKM